MDVEAVRRAAETPVQGLPADLGEVVQTLSDAFAVDPHFDWFMRADARRDRVRHEFFRTLVGQEALKGRVDRPASGGAAAVWMPFEWLAPVPLSAELQMLPMMLRTTGNNRPTSTAIPPKRAKKASARSSSSGPISTHLPQRRMKARPPYWPA